MLWELGRIIERSEVYSLDKLNSHFFVLVGILDKCCDLVLHCKLNRNCQGRKASECVHKGTFHQHARDDRNPRVRLILFVLSVLKALRVSFGTGSHRFAMRQKLRQRPSLR